MFKKETTNEIDISDGRTKIMCFYDAIQNLKKKHKKGIFLNED